MLPQTAGSVSALSQLPVAEFRAMDPESFRLAHYLEAFLRLIDGAPNAAAVHDHIDGRRLVPYQAAIQRGDWKRAWAHLEAPFRRQRTVYRHVGGGKCAPEICVGQKPRFAPLTNDNGPRNTTVQANDLERLPVRRTFVHYDSQGEPDKDRTVSTIDIPHRVLIC